MYVHMYISNIILAMYFNKPMSIMMRRNCCSVKKHNVYTEITPLLLSGWKFCIVFYFLCTYINFKLY